MKKNLLFTGLIIITAAAVWFINRQGQNPKKFTPQTVSNGSLKIMKISSPVFLDNSQIPAKYTCDGLGLNPPLQFAGVPNAAQSLALIVEDPDAPAGTWYHWLVWNIGPQVLAIAENSVPAGAVLGTTSFGSVGYGGPCPPSGTHHYIFNLFALDTKLNLPALTQNEALRQALAGHILSEAVLTGLYTRQ